MNKNGQTIYIIDDDDAVRDSLALLMESVGLQALTFASAGEFLDAFSTAMTGCVVLDIRMPGMNGLDLQARLNQLGSMLPIIFITGHGDIPMAVQAMQEGATDFLQKPFRDQDLLDRINQAMTTDGEQREALEEKRQIERRISSLTARERQVMKMVVDGKANKVIASDLGVSQRTVEIHRAHVMEKMQAASIAQLVRLVMRTRS
jgi:RNA polymerase sigma factor (sigma-70 family)